MDRIDLADPDCEPGDAELEALLRRAFADVHTERARALARLRQDIARERACVLARLHAETP